MNYIGSKVKLSDWIKEQIKNCVGNDLSGKVFCDLFAGTGAIGRALKKEVKSVISNDIEFYSYVLNKNYIENYTVIENSQDLILELNSLALDTGFIYDNYCLGSGSERLYFSDYNGKKIDTIRKKIEIWKKDNFIQENVYYFLLASLLESADKVANTASVYGAFLKKLKKSAENKLVLNAAEFELNCNEHKVYQRNANELIQEVSGDILYLDPPYNARQYGANYHLLNTIALYDNPCLKGKTGLREYTRSKYCSKSTVISEFENLIKNSDFQYIFLSYNNEGLMSVSQIGQIMEKYGRYDVVEKNYQRFKADKSSNRNHKADSTFEYLHILEKI